MRGRGGDGSGERSDVLCGCVWMRGPEQWKEDVIYRVVVVRSIELDTHVNCGLYVAAQINDNGTDICIFTVRVDSL